MLKTMLILAMTLTGLYQSFAQIAGCTDPLALNFNASASQNDGSCIYPSASLKPILSWVLPVALDETSGLILWDQHIWTHNDDTDIQLFRLQPGDFSTVQTYELTGVSNTDWEEIAQDEMYVYVGDFGNNGGTRQDLHILRIEKNSLLARQPLIDTIWFSYEGQNFNKVWKSKQTDFDCEAFIVSEDSIYLFTKEWISEKTSVYSLPKTPGNYMAKYLENYDVNGLITGSGYLEDKKLVVLSGYSSLLQPFLVFLYDFDEHRFFSGNKRKVSLDMPFHQVEGIATTDGLNMYISNERFTQSVITVEQKLHYLDVSDFLGDYLAGLTRSYQADLPSNTKIYPNPFDHELNIEADSINAVNFEMLNSIGKTVLKGRFEAKKNIETSRLAPGFYLLKLQWGVDTAYHKVIKK
jgi:hypothetical protein